jgi:hypothetical protein
MNVCYLNFNITILVSFVVLETYLGIGQEVVEAMEMNRCVGLLAW